MEIDVFILYKCQMFMSNSLFNIAIIIPYQFNRDHLTHMHVLVNSSPGHTYTQELVLSYFGHWLLPWFLLCKRVMILHVQSIESPRLYLFYCVNLSVQYQVSMTWPLMNFILPIFDCLCNTHVLTEISFVSLHLHKLS